MTRRSISRTERYVEQPNPPAAYCRGKESFPTWLGADRVIKRKQAAQRARGEIISAFTIYACKRCGGFHLAGNR